MGSGEAACGRRGGRRFVAAMRRAFSCRTGAYRSSGRGSGRLVNSAASTRFGPTGMMNGGSGSSWGSGEVEGIDVGR
jgi:hypothetical protein